MYMAVIYVLNNFKTKLRLFLYFAEFGATNAHG